MARLERTRRPAGALLRALLPFVAASALASTTRADELLLSGGALIRGTILKETSDALHVDLGFTVLTVPRSQILERRRCRRIPKVPRHLVGGRRWC